MFLNYKNIQEKLSSFISPSLFNVTGDDFLSHFTFTAIFQLIINILTIYLIHQLDFF